MYAAKLTFALSQDISHDWLLEELDLLTIALRNSGQLLDYDPILIEQTSTLEAFVRLPKPDALDHANCGEYVRKRLGRLNSGGIKSPVVEILGCDLSNPRSDFCYCGKSPSYILMVTMYAESPIRCGGCFNDVPAYEIPPTSKGRYYDNLQFWEHDYRRCDGLFMGGSTGERFSYREMSGHDSSLGIRGRDVCERIESLTGVPTYYFLMRHQGTPGKKERERKCPACGGDWRLEQPWHEIIAFRCDSCRLVSEFTKST